MNNIWGFLLQTLQLSLIACVILFMKTILKDKLPPVWHYGIWSVLAVAVLAPAGYRGRYILRKPNIYFHAVKTLTENRLDSVYTVAENPVYNTHVLPVITTAPKSITDILFIIYIIGITICILNYIISYMKLGKIISSAAFDSEAQKLTDSVAEKYKLKSCCTKVAKGLPSAFVCGVFKPVLLLPADKETDEKVILHELLHLKYKDLRQKMVWSLFRRLHWPNFFLQYIFDYINNDMESLRDNRVLQKLQGEELRDYGKILLSMTNDKYSSAFGTTSISNGSRFIAKRIETITRFKKYPRGMGLVAVCITIIMLPCVFISEKGPEFMENYSYASTEFDRQLQMEEYRLTNCSTIAGALDVYGKSLIHKKDEQALAVKPMEIKTKKYRLPDVYEISYEAGYPVYYVTNIKQTNENIYSAYVMLKGINYGTDIKSTEYYLIPVNIIKENGSWKVYQTRDYKKSIYDGVIDSVTAPPKSPDYDGGTQYIHHTDYGDVKITIDNITFFVGQLNGYRYPDAEFLINRGHNYFDFIPNEKLYDYEIVAVSISKLTDITDNFDISEVENEIAENSLPHGSATSGGNSLFLQYTRFIKNDMRGIFKSSMVNYNGDMAPAPAYQIDIWADGKHIVHFKIDTESGEIFE